MTIPCSTRQAILARIQHCLENSLDLVPHKVQEDAFLVRDLGAASIDMLDLVFRLSRDFNLTIDMTDIQAQLLGGLRDDEFFNKDRTVTERGYARMAELVPGFERSRLDEDLTDAGLFQFIQVRHLVDLVEQCVAHSAPISSH